MRSSVYPGSTIDTIHVTVMVVEPWRTSMVDGYGMSTGTTGCAKNPGLCTWKRAIFHNFGAERKQKYGKKVYLLDNKDG